MTDGFVPAPPIEIERMTDLLTEVKQRMGHAAGFLQDGAEVLAVETAALLLRQSIELIALSSLISHEHLLQQGRGALRRLDGEAARKAVRKLNPHYWPQPVTDEWVDGTRRLSDVEGRFLREADYGRWIGRTSDWLHATNPWRSTADVRQGAESMRELHELLVRLLSHFLIKLAVPGPALACLMDSSPNGQHVPGTGEVQVTLLLPGPADPSDRSPD